MNSILDFQTPYTGQGPKHTAIELLDSPYDRSRLGFALAAISYIEPSRDYFDTGPLQVWATIRQEYIHRLILTNKRDGNYAMFEEQQHLWEKLIYLYPNLSNHFPKASIYSRRYFEGPEEVLSLYLESEEEIYQVLDAATQQYYFFARQRI